MSVPTGSCVECVFYSEILEKGVANNWIDLSDVLASFRVP